MIHIAGGRTMDNRVRILLISNDYNRSEELILQLNTDNAVIQAITSNEVAREVSRVMPHIVLLHAYDGNAATELIQHIQQESIDNFQPISFYLADQQDFSLFRNLVREGIQDYFVLPDELDSLNNRLQQAIHAVTEQLTSKKEAIATDHALKKRKGRIHSFYSGKGGVGKTLLSTLYAQTVKLESTADVLFIDLNMQYGGAETFLGVDRIRSYAELLPVMDELNESHIRNVAVKEPYSKLDLLLSPQDAEIEERMTDEHITRLLRTCSRAYDIVIVDIPSHMDAKAFSALEESEMIHYVMTLDTPSITLFKRVQDLFTRLRLDTEDRLQVVMNRLERSNELLPSDVNEFITFPVAAKIREDKKGVLPSINKGEPLRKEIKEKKLPAISKQVRKWVISQLK